MVHTILYGMVWYIIRYTVYQVNWLTGVDEPTIIVWLSDNIIPFHVFLLHWRLRHTYLCSYISVNDLLTSFSVYISFRYEHFVPWAFLYAFRCASSALIGCSRSSGITYYVECKQHGGVSLAMFCIQRYYTLNDEVGLLFRLSDWSVFLWLTSDWSAVFWLTSWIQPRRADFRRFTYLIKYSIEKKYMHSRCEMGTCFTDCDHW